MKKFIEDVKKTVSTTTDIFSRAISLGLRYGIAGGIVIGGISSLFVSAPVISLLAFGAGVGGLVAGGGYFVANVVEDMWSTGDKSVTHRKIAAGALLAAASATALYFTGTPRAAAENQTAGTVAATANAAFANCPAEKRVTTITQDAKGKQVVTMTCKK